MYSWPGARPVDRDSVKIKCSRLDLTFSFTVRKVKPRDVK